MWCCTHLQLPGLHAVQKQLQLLSIVKDVHPEQQVRRSLTWDSTQGQQQTDSAWVQKRPGRCAFAISAPVHFAATSVCC